MCRRDAPATGNIPIVPFSPHKKVVDLIFFFIPDQRKVESVRDLPPPPSHPQAFHASCQACLNVLKRARLIVDGGERKLDDDTYRIIAGA